MRIWLPAIALLACCAHAEDRHHFSGMARVSGQGMSSIVSAQQEDFDPIHTPALSLQALYRVRLTPSVAGNFNGLPFLNQNCSVTATATSAGHHIATFCGWTIDITPADRQVLLFVQSTAGGSATAVQTISTDIVDGALEITFRQ